MPWIEEKTAFGSFRLSGQTQGQTSSHQDMVLKIYEAAMCCSIGVCGPNVDSRLVAFAGALKQIASMGVMP